MQRSSKLLIALALCVIPAMSDAQTVGPVPGAGGGSGTVTSVGLGLPSSLLTVSGSPVTTSGTLTGTLATQTANTVFSGPTTGAAATPTFRSLVAADLPAGTGTVTSVATGACLTGGPITTTGTVSGTYVIDVRTTTTEAITATSACKLVTFNNGSATAASLVQATGSAGAGFSFDVENLGAGLVTITPTTSTINGASTLTVAQNTGCSITSDGTNYQISACTAKVPGGTVTSITCNGGLSGGAITTSGTCSLNLSSANVWAAQQSNAIATLAISTATFTPDGSNNNYKLTLVHASCPCTLANPSATPVAGTSGVIEVTQSATGSDVISTWGSQYLYAGGTSTIAFTTAANATDSFSYYVRDSTHIVLSTAALNATH